MRQSGAGRRHGERTSASRWLITLAVALAALAVYFIVGENEPGHIRAGLLLLFCSLVALGLGLRRQRR